MGFDYDAGTEVSCTYRVNPDNGFQDKARLHPFCMFRVLRKCLCSLSKWSKPWFLSQGPVLGTPCRWKIVLTDASLTGWGVVTDGHFARGLWQDHHHSWHIDCLEMLVVFNALRSLLPPASLCASLYSFRVCHHMLHALISGSRM